MHHVTPDSQFVVAAPVFVSAPSPGKKAEGPADCLDRIVAMLECVLQQQPQ